MARPWKGKDVMVNFVNAADADTVAEFSGGTEYQAVFKKCEVKPGDREPGEQKYLGGTSDAWTEDPNNTEFTGDTILNPKNGAVLDLDEIFHTIDPATDEFTYDTDLQDVSAFVRFGDATNYVGFILTDLKLKTPQGMSVEPTGTGDSSFASVCTPANTKKVYGGTYAKTP